MKNNKITNLIVYLSLGIISLVSIGVIIFNIYNFFKNSTFEFNYSISEPVSKYKTTKIEARFDNLLNTDHETECFMQIMNLNSIESGSYFDKNEGGPNGLFEIKNIFLNDSTRIKENIDLLDCVSKTSFYYEGF